MARTIPRVTLSAAVGIALLGCAAVRSTDERPVDIHELPVDIDALRSGTLLFEEPVDSSEVSDVNILGLDDAMRHFIATEVANAPNPRARMGRLLHGMRELGYFDVVYDAELTLSAAEAFHSKAGNCLAYTNMFIALAREAGLDARYQIVAVPPTWALAEDLVIRSNHINVLVRGVRLDVSRLHEFVVDFNQVAPDGEFETHIVSDAEARALFYMNLSVEHLKQGEDRKTFAYLMKAIETDPNNADFWVNLGVLHSRRDHLDGALQAYSLALELDPKNKSAVAGLAAVYAELGQVALALHFEAKIRGYREANPYFHFAHAREAYDGQRYKESLRAIKVALRKQPRTGAFYFMKALAQLQLENPAGARRSLERAERYGRYKDLLRRYGADLTRLTEQWVSVR